MGIWMCSNTTSNFAMRTLDLCVQNQGGYYETDKLRNSFSYSYFFL